MSDAPPPVASLLDLRGRRALVTGASGGIGAGIARRLAEAGARVAVHGHAHRAAAEAVAASIDGAVVVLGDVATDAEALVAGAVAELGGLDIVVNNAGWQPVGALLELTATDVAEMLRVNVVGVAAVTAAFGHHVLAHGPGDAAVVNIASIEGLQPAAGHSHYAASKAAVLMHTRAAALELGRHGIRVNAVAPGLVERPGLGDDWPEGVARWHAASPLGRLGRPDDVADAVLFLASAAARWITGATLVVDGGVLTRSTW